MRLILWLNTHARVIDHYVNLLIFAHIAYHNFDDSLISVIQGILNQVYYDLLKSLLITDYLNRYSVFLIELNSDLF